jgi:hypothetical protein
MVGKGLKNMLFGAGKFAGGVLLYTVSGAETVASSGTGTPVAILGFIGAGILTSNGGFQATAGFAETLAGLVTPDPIPTKLQESVPETLTEVMAITADNVISSATGKETTSMQKAAEVIDTLQELAIPTPGGKVGAIVVTFFSYPGTLDEYVHPSPTE